MKTSLVKTGIIALAIVFTDKLVYSQTIMPPALYTPSRFFWSTSSLDKDTNHNVYEVDGSPYLFDDWLSAELKAADGTVYKDVKIKYDILTNEVLAERNTDKKIIALKNLQSFTIKTGTGETLIFKRPPLSANNFNHDNFYQVLLNGGITLLKKTKKELSVTNVYNSTIPDSRIKANVEYFTLIGNKLTKFKRNQKNLIKIFPTHQKELASFITNSRINLKNDNDLVKVFMFYNKLS